jgi:hypothetical protein
MIFNIKPELSWKDGPLEKQRPTTIHPATPAYSTDLDSITRGFELSGP